jgi:cytokinin dehydrogenase
MIDQVTRQAFTDAGITIDESATATEAASTDFGHIARGLALGVLRPKTSQDVAAAVRIAAQRGLRVTVRSGGMSQSGQSVPVHGLSLDVREVRFLERRGTRAHCGPGVTWRELLSFLAPDDLAPYVVPLNLDLTIGGTLSAAGFGSTSHRYGPAASHVHGLEVVLADGSIASCGPTENTALFDVVLGGLGRFGVIVGVELPLRRLPSKVRTFYFVHDDISQFLADQQGLASHADHLEGFCSASVQGLRKGPTGRRQPYALWSYGLHASVEHDGRDPETLQSSGRLIHVEDDDAAAFASRYDVRFDVMRATGAWDQAHPWLECMLPLSVAAEVVPRALDMMSVLLGDGHRMTLLADRPVPTSIALPDDRPLVSFAVLPLSVPPYFLERGLALLSAVNDLLLHAGGKRYVSGWMFQPSWANHFAQQEDEINRRKQRFDPGGVFEAMLTPQGSRSP